MRSEDSTSLRQEAAPTLLCLTLALFCDAGLFSATQTEAVQSLARAGLRNPVRINVAVAGAPSAGAKGADAGGGGGQKTPSELSIRYLVCDMDQKLPYLMRFLQVQPSDPSFDQSLIIFTPPSKACQPHAKLAHDLIGVCKALVQRQPARKALEPAV